MDNRGDFVIAWQNYINGTSSIDAQRFDEHGRRRGDQFRVNRDASNNAASPSVAMDADGDFVVAWHCGLYLYDGTGVVARRFDNRGNAHGAEFDVATGPYTSNANVAMDPNGDFVIAWQSGRYEYPEFISAVHARRYDRIGNAEGATIVVDEGSEAWRSLPSVAMDADGDFVVAWQSYGSVPGSSAPQGNRSRNGDVCGVGGGYGGYGYGYSYDAFGHFVSARRYTATDPAQGEAILLSDGPYYLDGSPSVAMNPRGDAVIAWHGYGTDDPLGIFAARYVGAADAAKSARLSGMTPPFTFDTSANSTSPQVDSNELLGAGPLLDLLAPSQRDGLARGCAAVI
jgi:hypothetical protein